MGFPNDPSKASTTLRKKTLRTTILLEAKITVKYSNDQEII